MKEATPTATLTEQLPILILESRAALREDENSGKVASKTSPGFLAEESIPIASVELLLPQPRSLGQPNQSQRAQCLIESL